MPTESKKLQTTLDSETPGLFSIALSGDPEEGLLERAEPEELEHDARIAHEQREVIRKLAEAGQAVRSSQPSHSLARAHAEQALDAALVAAAPFLED